MVLSVIVPVINGEEDFHTCLKALTKSNLSPYETIIVDDGSAASTDLLASRYGAKVLSMEGKRRGLAAARNRGARIAQGDILVFINPDVVVHPDTLTIIKITLEENPDISALFGAYDDASKKPGAASHDRSVQLPFIHLNGRRETAAFWAGCCAVRRNVFRKMGGFNESYPRPSIEDIAFGLRLKLAGYRIWFCPEALVNRVEPQALSNHVRSDVLDRALP